MHYDQDMPVFDERMTIIGELEAKIKAIEEALFSVLSDAPLPNGEYVHSVVCSGDRRQPPGTPGISCSCMPKKKAIEEERDRLKAELADMTQKLTNEGEEVIFWRKEERRAKAELAEAREYIKRLNDELGDERESADEAETALAEVRDEAIAYKAIRKMCGLKECDSLATFIDVLLTEMDKAREEIGRLKAEKEQKQLRIDNLRQQLIAQEAELAEARKIPMKYKRMEFNAQLQNELIEARNEIGRLRELLQDQPEETAVWELLNKFATGETQGQWSRVEPIAVLGEVYFNFASARSRRQAALAGKEGKDGTS